VKAGISYLSANGFQASLFNLYQGPLDSKYNTVLNPSPGAYDKLSFHMELNLKKYFHWHVRSEPSLIVHADNLLNQEIWLPAWGLAQGESIPYEKGRAIYAGLRVTF